MKKYRPLAIGIQRLVAIGIIILSWQIPARGEFEAVVPVPGVVKGTLEIAIRNLSFQSEGAGTVANNVIVVPVGMRVRWTNMDPLNTVNGELGLMPHGIQISDESEEVFVASNILTREANSFNYTFEEEGTYTYACFIHSFMRGKVMVINLHSGPFKDVSEE